MKEWDALPPELKAENGKIQILPACFANYDVLSLWFFASFILAEVVSSRMGAFI